MSPFNGILNKRAWNALYWFEFLNLFVSMLLELTSVIQTTAEGSFIDLFTMVPCVGYLTLGMVKSFKITYNRPVYENLISELRDMWPRNTVTEEEYNIMYASCKQVKYVLKGYFYCNIVLVLFFVVPPYIVIFRCMLGEDIPLKLAFSYWFPFDPYQHGRFEAIIVLQTLHCYLSVCLMLIADLLFCIYLNQITTQLDLLAFRIKKLFYVPIDDQLIETYPLAKYTTEQIKEHLEATVGNKWGITYQNQLVEIVKRHRDLIRLSTDVEGEFTFALLINFINSSVIICFCGFCCVFVEKWNEINYKLFLSTAIVQIWLLCWYGQKLLDSSQGIFDAVYNSGWYNVPHNIKSSLIIIFYRAQKEVFVTTYGFSIISMRSYSTLMAAGLFGSNMGV
ncbi:unnamed protein product, partial [Iphiclides podalirius]